MNSAHRNSKFSPLSAARQSQLCRAALYYAKLGWPVLPLRPRSKSPLTKHGYKDATTDERTIRSWWERWPNANVGIATGAASGVVVLDVDPRAGGLESLQELMDRHGPLPQTPIVETGGGGLHYYFAVRGSVRSRRLAHGLELKADGGYIVAPPSLHPTGKPYRWLHGHTPKDLPLAELPEWILASLISADGARAAPEAPVAPSDAVSLPASGDADAPEVVHEGQRHDFLVRLAGKLRAAGFSVEAIESALLIENARRCRPPLPESEVRTIAKSFARYPPRPNLRGDGSGASALARLDEAFTDRNLARLFARLARERALYVPQWGWLVWDGRRWTLDAGGHRVATMAADELPLHFARLAVSAKDSDARREALRAALKAMSRHRISAALEMAKGWLLAEPSDFDRDPFLLNVLNGTLDLRTGELRPHDPAARLTKLASVVYDPDATAPTWRKFLEDVFLGDQDLIAYVQRALGYSITGDTREEVVFICYGTGRNGKSVLLETIASILGDYARVVPQDLILARGEREDTHPAVLAELVGVRMALIVETEEDRRLNAARLKGLSGQDTLTARHLYRPYFNFRPQAKLWLRTNYKPRVSDHTPAMWERLRLIPFRAYFPPERRDKTLREKLLAEASGILNWLLAGIQEWIRIGLREPDAVLEATESYRQEQDLIGQWISERCVVDPKAVTAFKELFDDYQAWCQELGEQPISARRFATSLEERGFAKTTLDGKAKAKARRGIRLREPPRPAGDGASPPSGASANPK
jgi:putative DNA primase/helicase